MDSKKNKRGSSLDRQRQERIDKEMLSLQNVPFSSRPMTSTDKDQFIGQDEAGNSVYRTPLGQEYTVKLDPDQRTTRTKITEDVIPAIVNYAKDPSLPSLEDTGQFLKVVQTCSIEPT